VDGHLSHALADDIDGAVVEFPKARHKIEEAEFFFVQLDRHAQRAVLEDDRSFWDLRVFRFYLSAFLGAGMSVRQDVLRSEHKGTYLAAYPTWEAGLSPDDRRVWDSMKDRRDEEVHLANIKVLREIALMPLADTWWRRAGRAPFADVTPAERDAPVQIGALRPKFVNPDGSETDVFDECRTYLGLLRGLLAACEQHTPASP
jgi:hypothetical protein